jgi:TonB family protein
MRSRVPIAALALFAVLLVPGARCGAEDQHQGVRKILARTAPVYPDLARRLQLSGVARVLVTVMPDGTVREAKPLGGNPVFLQAAQEALRKWKWEAAPTESREIIEISFHPIN